MKKALNIFMAITILAGFVWSCSDDDEDSLFRLQVDNTNVTITSVNIPVILTIISGNEGYTVHSNDQGIVTAELSGISVILKGVGEGTTRVFVSDKEKRSVAIQVTVSFTLPTSEFLNWNGIIKDFDKPGEYGISILSGKVALTDLASENEDRKQIILSWSGGMTVGEKTNGKLKSITPDGVEEAISFTSLKIIRADDLGTYIVFTDGSRSGELFFLK
jgi:hypothetical protein